MFCNVYKKYSRFDVLNIIPERLSPYFWFICRVAPFSFWRPPRPSVRIQKRTTSSILSSPTRSKHTYCYAIEIYYLILYYLSDIRTLISNKLPGQGFDKELEMSLKTLQNNISAIQERKKFDIASIMAAQTAQQNQETIGKFLEIPKKSLTQALGYFLGPKFSDQIFGSKVGLEKLKQAFRIR